MSKFTIDYFATVGRKPGSFVIKNKHNGSTSAGDIWDNAITDVGVALEDEVFDDSWEVLDRSSTGLELFRPHIIIKRRKESKKLDHITKIQLVQAGGIIPTGMYLYVCVYAPILAIVHNK